MAPKKITELAALTTPALTDVVPIVDMSGAPATKKSTLAQIATVIGGGIPTAHASSHNAIGSDPLSGVSPSQITGTAVVQARQIISGGGLTGGGDLSADRTLAVGAGTGVTVNADDVEVKYGTIAGTAAQGSDSRLSDARTPTAHASTHKSAGSDPIKLDELKAPDDSTTLDATTSLHGLESKATAPAAGLLSVLAIGNGETKRTDQAIFDTTNPAALGTAAPGTSKIAARRDHVHAIPTNALLDGSAHSDTTVSPVTRGDLIYGNSTPAWDDLAVGIGVLHANGTDVTGWSAVSLTADVSGDLPFANLVPATAISVLVGRGSAAGAGDFQEITLGTGLTMTNQVLSASGTPGGSDTQVQFNNAGAFGGDAGLTYDKTTDILTVVGSITTPSINAPANLILNAASGGTANIQIGSANVIQTSLSADGASIIRIDSSKSYTGVLNRGITLQPALTLAIGADGYGTFNAPSFVKAGSGTHAIVATFGIQTPTMTGSGATVTTGVSCYIENAPSFGTNNYALLVDSGNTRMDGFLGITSALSTTAPAVALDILAGDNTTAVIIKINATQANITAADKYVSFASTSGEEANVIGTAVAGVIAYNTFTGAHKTITEGDPQPLLLLEMTGERIPETEFARFGRMVPIDKAKRVSSGDVTRYEGPAPKEFLPYTRVCQTRASNACFGVYAGRDSFGVDMALALGTGWMLVANTGQDIPVGSYLISSAVPGHAELQNDDIKRASTVASVSETIQWQSKETSRRVAVRYLMG